MAVLDSALALGLGLGPSAAVLYHAVDRFHHPNVDKTLMDDAKLFLSFAVGMILGAVSGVFDRLIPLDDVLSILVLLFLLALFEETFKLLYVNFKRFQKRFDTTYYGLAIGLGMAATLNWSNAQQIVSIRDGTGIVLLLLFSLIVVFLHAFTGSVIGFGSAHAQNWRCFPQAVLTRGLFILVLAPVFVGSGLSAGVIVSLGLALLLAFVLYYFTYKFYLVQTLPRELFPRKRPKAGD